MKTEFSTALRDAAQELVDIQFGDGITVGDPVRHSRNELGRWRATVAEDNILARFDCPVFISMKKANSGVVLEAALEMSTKGDRQGAKARAERLRSQGKTEQAERALQGVRDVIVFDIESAKVLLRRMSNLLRVRKVLKGKGKQTLLSNGGNRLVVIGDGTIIGAANHGRALYVRAAGSQDRVPVKNVGHAVAATFDAAKVAEVRKAAKAAKAAAATAS